MRINAILKLLLGPFLFIMVLLVLKHNLVAEKVALMAGITAWIASWWLTEVVDLAITSLLPLILLPIFGIMDAKTTASQYNDQVIFLFVGGFILSFAIEKWQLHKRISLKILSLIGSSPSMILAGVMGTTYFISMWMSNTATVMMLLSAVVAINYNIQHEFSDKIKNKIPSALLLGLAYASSIGGMATLVGTPTNMIFYSFYQTHIPHSDYLSFTKWFEIAFPISFCLLIGTYLVLRYTYISKETNIKFDKSYFKNSYKDLGPLSYEEKMVTLLFSVTAILWFTRSNMDFGPFKFYGWSNLFRKDFIQDSTVAILMATLLFIIPSKKEKGQHLLHWEDAKKIPYDIVLLFGSGFALAKGFDVSGLSTWLAGQLHFLKDIHPLIMVLIICAVVCFISEFASNVASIQLTLPILMALSQSLHIEPLLLMIPATLAASLGYILPVATAPNTIVYGTKLFPVKHMLKSGFYIDLLGIILISLAVYFLV